jgi:ribonuclease HI
VTNLATIHFDGGGQTPGPVSASCIVKLSDGSVKKAIEHFDKGTHNTAEYQALILGLHTALKHGQRHVVAYGDSTVVVKQMKREWKTNNEALLSLRTKADELVSQFESFDVKWIPRSENRAAHELGRAK